MFTCHVNTRRNDDCGMQFRTFLGQELAKGAVTRNTAARLWCNRERERKAEASRNSCGAQSNKDCVTE